MMKPLNDNVLVERIERDSVSKGGIIIPDTAKEKPAQGIVVAVGPGKRDKAGKHIEIDAKCGERNTSYCAPTISWQSSKTNAPRRAFSPCARGRARSDRRGYVEGVDAYGRGAISPP